LSLRPIAVLLLGDIENGKFDAVDKTNMQFGNGEPRIFDFS
jgi:hypothetical protein